MWELCLSYRSIHRDTNAFRDNFPRFDFWGDFILSEFQNKFCACSAHLGQKYESRFIFNPKIPASLWARDCVLVRGTNKLYVKVIDNLYVIVHARRRGCGT